MSAQRIITENLDLWTNAITHKSNAGRGSSGKLELTGIKKLRELILELAVRGKLVPQDPNDEPASELLKRIEAEKVRLEKEGKIRKPKKFPKISEDEKPYDLPAGWFWARLEQVGRDWGQKTPDRDFSYIDVSAVDNNKGIVSSPTVLSADAAPSRARKLVQPGTVIYSTVRPYLKNIALVGGGIEPEPIVSTAFAIVHPLGGMPARYFLHYFRSPAFVRYVESVQTGIAYPAINDKQFFSGLVPVAPVAEQHRIVEKVDELMALCDHLEQQTSDQINAHETLVDALLDTLVQAQDAAELADKWARLATNFDALFTSGHSIDRFRRTVFELAATGKFCFPIKHSHFSKREPLYDGFTESSETFLKVAKDEINRLVLAGKAKNEKIKPLDIPSPYHDIPSGWTQCCLSDVTVCLDHKRVPIKKSERTEGSVPYYGANGPVGYIGESLFNEDLVLVVEDETFIGRTKPFSYMISGPSWVNNHAHVLKCTSVILPEFLNLLLSYYPFIPLTSGTTGRKKLTKNTLLQIPIIVAPIEVQRAIVGKVEQLMTLCDQLKERLSLANETRCHLAEAVVEQAVA